MDGSRWGAWAGIAAAPAATWVCAAVALQEASALHGSWTAEQVLVIAAGIAGAVIAGHLTVVTIVTLASAALRGVRAGWGPAVARVTPHAWRSVLATALGTGLAAGIAGPSLATGIDDGTSIGWVAAPGAVAAEAAPTPGPGASPPMATAPDAEAAVTGILPALPAPPVVAEQESTGRAGGDTYTVVPGDSLWRITQGLLGAGATDAEIARAWPVLYEANRGVIGANPSLIFAGQELQLPASLA